MRISKFKRIIQGENNNPHVDSYLWLLVSTNYYAPYTPNVIFHSPFLSNRSENFAVTAVCTLSTRLSKKNSTPSGQHQRALREKHFNELFLFRLFRIFGAAGAFQSVNEKRWRKWVVRVLLAKERWGGEVIAVYLERAMVRRINRWILPHPKFSLSSGRCRCQFVQCSGKRRFESSQAKPGEWNGGTGTDPAAIPSQTLA